MESKLLNNVDMLIQINENLLAELGMATVSKLPTGIAKALFHGSGGKIFNSVEHILAHSSKKLTGALGEFAQTKIRPGAIKGQPTTKLNTQELLNKSKSEVAVANASANGGIAGVASQTKSALKEAMPEINKDAADISQKVIKKSGLMKKLTGTGIVGGGGLLAADQLIPNQTQAQTNTPTISKPGTTTISKPAINSPAINSPAAKVAEVQHAKLLNQNPWKLDSKGNVLGTRLTPSQYNQGLEQRLGVDGADKAIRKAMGPGWGDGSNYHRK